VATRPPPPRQGISALLLALIFFAVAALLFFAIYVSLPADAHFGALILIGSLALVFALLCYIFEFASRDPAAQRSLSYGFAGMGFATLFLSIGLGPSYGVESTGNMLLGLIVMFIVLGITVALVMWRVRAVAADAPREAARQAWRQEQPVSAFSYTTANSPGAPTTTPAPATPTQNPPPGR
jgi:hypothetical protein